ncbi:hypothetical protein RRG08_029252 [Elysia crispata]|uniref:Uncharacterized protein n=1 Tax=Elysia crispata TaxID=231223 RepID=A0AAE1E093_9GAST|nr:hypothetical protein RRG08_029252 [Elysia crispata]
MNRPLNSTTSPSQTRPFNVSPSLKQYTCIDEALCLGADAPSLESTCESSHMRNKAISTCENNSGYVAGIETMAQEPNVCNTPFSVCQRLINPYLDHSLFVDYYCAPASCDFLVANNSVCRH